MKKFFINIILIGLIFALGACTATTGTRTVHKSQCTIYHPCEVVKVGPNHNYYVIKVRSHNARGQWHYHGPYRHRHWHRH